MSGARWAVTALVVALLGCGGDAPAPPPDAAPGEDTSSTERGAHRRAPLPSAAEIAKLPPDGGPAFNRLVFSRSPYLLQHARNPVDWYEWGDAAFEKARQEDRPILLSIGYSTCHWCHVMERESFEDPEVAQALNAGFVAIKVDREERPDVDQVYMAACLALHGSGGWPLTILLTPERRPFYAGTYLPKRTVGRRPGLMELLARASKLWREGREELDRSAAKITAALARRMAVDAGDPSLLTAATLERGFGALERSFDGRNGGFGLTRKFPVPHNVRFMLRHHDRTGNVLAKAIAVRTLDAMVAGGLHDHLGGGFHRYTVDPQWRVPHFEKMLYDQAGIAMALLEGYQMTGAPRYRDAARGVFRYVAAQLTGPDGQLYSAEDADSEGEEGRFYVWRKSEVEALLGPELAPLAVAYYGLSAEGNFEHRTNVLYTPRSLDDVARGLGRSVEVATRQLAEVGRRLLEARRTRERPFKDDKALTDWNALMIGALALGGRVLDDPRLIERARKTADWVIRTMWAEGEELRHVHRDGRAAGVGLLSDYAYLADALLTLYEACRAPEYLARAVRLSRQLVALFGDGEGGFYMTPAGGEALIARPRAVEDAARPSGYAVAVTALLRVARLTGDPAPERAAVRALARVAPRLSAGYGRAQFLIALDFLVGPTYEVVLAGDDATPGLSALRAVLDRAFRPRMVVLHRPAGAADALVALAPFVRPYGVVKGRAAAYVCTQQACQAPTSDPVTLASLLAPKREPSK